MANEQLLEILQGGVEAWNAWRRDNAGVFVDPSFGDLTEAHPGAVDLRGADLTGADLRGADLHGADLRGAHLGGADLRGADLSEAHLTGAHLGKANLHEAHLTGAHLTDAHLGGADLRGANFTRADLRGADLRVTDLRGAHLTGADLTEAHLTEAHLGGADLTEAHLTETHLELAYLTGADLRGADLRGAHLGGADLTEAHLTETHLGKANLHEAHLTGADLIGARLELADLTGADLRGADLRGAHLDGAQLVRTRLEQAKLNSCRVYGISAWDVMLDAMTQQHDLVITPPGQPSITVDNLEVAQFIYLLLRNKNIRHVIDTITSKVVLILGRFTAERKAVLDMLRDELRKRDRLPVIFDFDQPGTRDTHETITTLARMARYIIADITDPKSIPQELVSIVEQLPSVAVQPILQEAGEPWGMYDHIKRYPWVLPVRTYKAEEALVARLDELVIAPAEARVKEIRGGGADGVAGPTS